MNVAVLSFPGSNSRDCLHALRGLAGQTVVEQVWHTETQLDHFDAIIIPGGFSYGDYLRCGAIASHSPIMVPLKQAADKGKPIIGIGNGFQILTEAGLLPGVLRINTSLKFHCNNSKLKVNNHQTMFTSDYTEAEIIDIPVAHESGNYYCDEATLQQLQADRRIVFEYSEDNPNGSLANIAGIINEQGNVLGMMPHPERATDALLGSEDGKRLFTSMLKGWRG